MYIFFSVFGRGMGGKCPKIGGFFYCLVKRTMGWSDMVGGVYCLYAVYDASRTHRQVLLMIISWLTGW